MLVAAVVVSALSLVFGLFGLFVAFFVEVKLEGGGDAEKVVNESGGGDALKVGTETDRAAGCAGLPPFLAKSTVWSCCRLGHAAGSVGTAISQSLMSCRQSSPGPLVWGG